MNARIWCWLPTILMVAIVGLSGPVSADADAAAATREAERETFRHGWAAARRGDQSGMMLAIAALPDYPLTPYLEFEMLRQRVDGVPEVVMEQFLARHRDWSFARSLETSWLRSLGRRGEWEALLRHGRDNQDIEVRCHLAQARINQGEHDGLDRSIERLWLVGRSQPSACDRPFAWWRRQGNLSHELAWQRFEMAIEANETDLGRYLRRYLMSDQREWADRWLSMRAQPSTTLRRARQWQDHEYSRQLVSNGIRQLARSDEARARQHWDALAPRFSFSDAARHRVERDLALFQAVALDEAAIAAIDALPSGVRDQQMLEWRARVAMVYDRWPDVLDSIQAMAVNEQANARWRYWRGRALAEMNRPDALVAFGTLSAEANYYGFLAALKLDQALALCNEDLTTDVAVQGRLLRDAEFERAMELFHVGLNGHARQTWMHISRRLSSSELDQAALLAAKQGWHDRSIAALNGSGNRRAYPWRFPMAEKGRVMALARQYEVEPALIYGLMRAESAMQPDALSPAGARGLLQLMPTTAQAVARRNSLPYNGSADLMDPQVNLPLGIAHLAELQRRYDGDWVRVAAAYNAGINAVSRWMDSRPHSAPDVWMETLPFFETRDYVPRVLAFATIYEWQLDQAPTVLARHALGGDQVGPGFACPD